MGSPPTRTESVLRNDRLIILVNPPADATQKPGSGSELCVGIALIATVLKEAGYRVKLIDGSLDPNYYEIFQESLTQENPLFIGFSVMSSQVAAAYEMTKEAKEAQCKIVWGGFHPTIFPQQTIADPNIDFVVAGEGANVVVPLADCLATGNSLDSVPGIYFRQSEEVRFTGKQPLTQFNEIPDIDWSLYDRECLERVIVRVNDLGEEVRSLPLLTGLGCNFRCAFCFNAIFGLRHRAMDAERVVANMKRLVDQYRLDEIVFYDEHFFSDENRIHAFLKLLEEQPLGIRFAASIRASDIRRRYFGGDFLKRLRRVGGYRFGLGAESGNQRVLKKLNKGITVQNVRDVARLGRDNDILFVFSFMVGIPGESLTEVFDTLDLVRELQSIDGGRVVIIGPNIFRPYPGSSLFEEAVKAGLEVPDSLVGWTRTKVFSHFRSLGEAPMPWIKSYHLFERVMRTYNIQSYNANIEGLQSILFWTLYEKVPSRCLPPALLPHAQRISNWLAESIVKLSRWRLKNRNMVLMLEMPIVRFLERKYFANT